jgi:hypothetical protein
MPSGYWKLQVGLSFHARASRPLGFDQIRSQLNFRQSTGHQEPTMIGNHAHTAPSCLKQTRYALSDSFEFGCQLMDKSRLKAMAHAVD